jgi:hypothetical protein
MVVPSSMLPSANWIAAGDTLSLWSVTVRVLP